MLDTVAAPSPTVSSRTGTVALDTNKKDSLEQDLDRSNFEGSHDQGEETRRQAATAGTVGVTIPNNPPRNGTQPRSALGPASLKELIAHRRRIDGGPWRGRP